MTTRTREPVDLPLGQRLLAYWRGSGGTSLRPGARELDIAAFEAANRVTLPPDLREYFERVDGFDQSKSYHDDRGFNFWPLNKVSRVSRFENGHFHFANDLDYFLFCDYLDFSWGYAISLKRGINEIVLVGTSTGKPKRVASSFGEFVDAYLRDDERLYA